MTKGNPIAAGSILAGKYRVERQIGSGGMGVVVEATHLALDQRVAVKLLSPELAASPENVARFLREARVAASLPSEHIARVSDFGQTETGAPYLVMELLVGHDFAAEIERAGRLDVASAVDAILEACEGLAEAHAAGLVHRDIKPANLFIARRPGRSPILKLLDFGLTKDISHEGQLALTQTGSVFGTPQYMSPEQVMSSKNVDARSDQHALAMILFEALTGRPPYQGSSAGQLFVTIVTAPVPRARALRPEVPAALDAAIRRALAKDPDHRFPSLAGLAGAIAPFGGPSAGERAANVRRVLGTPRASVPEEAGGSSASPPSDVESTVPLATPRTSGTSQPDLTSSVDPAKRGRRAVRLAVLGGAAVVSVFALAAVVVLHGEGPRASPASTAVPEARSALATPSPRAGAPEAATAPTPAVTVTPSGSAVAPADPGAPASSVSSAAASSAGKGPAAGRPASSQSVVRKAIGVFGARR
jgi:eukaryotic-like serine/threonine-protein kinase